MAKNCLIFLFLFIFSNTAHAMILEKNKTCFEDVRRNGPCFKVQGTIHAVKKLHTDTTLQAYLWTEKPSLGYEFAFLSDEQQARVPESKKPLLAVPLVVLTLLTPTQDVRGEFHICPLGKPKQGAAPRACIMQADKITVRQVK